jgi:hypothetical protein
MPDVIDGRAMHGDWGFRDGQDPVLRRFVGDIEGDVPAGGSLDSTLPPDYFNGEYDYYFDE